MSVATKPAERLQPHDRLFSKLMNAKRNWNVMELDKITPVEGAMSTIQRGLALRKLEIPVGDFISATSDKEKSKLGDKGMELLQSNIEDEDRHDRQLNNAFNAMTSVDKEIEEAGQQICDRWIEMSDRYHPVLVAMCAENSVFFPLLALFRRLGGVALANVASEINRDEIIHVSTNRYICFDLLNLEVPSEIDELRKDTINWLVSELERSGIPGKYGRARTYRDASRDLLYKGTYNNFGDTKRAQFLSFFEISAANLPVYGS